MKVNQNNSIKFNFIMNLILTISNFIFPLITFPYISRVLLAEGNGKIAFVSAIVSYFSMVSTLGIPIYGVRACARVRDNKSELSKVVHELLIINTVLTILVLIPYFSSIIFLEEFRQYKVLFYINSLGIALNVISFSWFYQAIEEYKYITLRSLAFKVLSLFLVFIFVTNKGDYINYMFILVLSSVGSNVFNFIRLFKYIDFRWYGDYQFRRHFKPICILFFQNIIVSIYTNLDTIMIGYIRGSFEVGLFNAGTKTKAILLSIVTSLGNVVLPRMSYYVKKGMKKEFINILIKLINFTVFLSLPIAIYFSIYSKEVILLLAGDSFLLARYAMLYLTISLLPNALTGVLGVQVLTPLEKEKYVVYSVIIGALVDFILNLIVIPRWGSSGAAFSTMLAEFAVLFVQIYYTKEYLKEIYQKINILPYILATILAIIVSIFTRNFVSNNFFILVISGFLFFMTYLLVLRLLNNSFILEIENSVKTKLKRRN